MYLQTSANCAGKWKSQNASDINHLMVYSACGMVLNAKPLPLSVIFWTCHNMPYAICQPSSWDEHSQTIYQAHKEAVEEKLTKHSESGRAWKDQKRINSAQQKSSQHQRRLSQEEDRDNNWGHMRRESQWKELHMVQESSTMFTHSSSLVALTMTCHLPNCSQRIPWENDCFCFPYSKWSHFV